MMRKLSFLVLTGVMFVGMTSCQNLNSPNFNFEDLQNLVDNPTPTGLYTAAQGMLITRRDMDANGPNDFYSNAGIVGRESYDLDINDPRFESELLSSQLSPDSPAFGGNFWSEPYENVRVGSIILAGIPNSTPPLSDNDTNWLEGFVKTMMAYDLMEVALLRDTQCGCPVTASESLTEPAPAVSVDQVWARVIQLLDEAASDVQQASGDSPIPLSTGFDGIAGVVQVGFFRTAAGFLQFNRALRARAAMYNQDWNGMLQALSASFISDLPAALNLGVYHVFTSQSGDVLNGLAQFGTDPNLRGHPSYKADVELKADGTPDDRFTRKARPISSRSYQGLCQGDPAPQPWAPDPRYTEDPGGGSAQRECDVGFNLYPTTTSPVSIIRNEELLLMRAEANIQLGNLGAAQADINLVRDVSGGLEPVTLTSANAIDQLLYERQFSLWWENAHRWKDMRRYNRLNELPVDKAGHGVASFYPIPQEETTARQ
jgi:hypothetical protein